MSLLISLILHPNILLFFQTRVALRKILDDLAEDDHFGLICFDDEVSPWKHELVRATQQNLEQAKEFVKTITAGGGKVVSFVIDFTLEVNMYFLHLKKLNNVLLLFFLLLLVKFYTSKN